jgi:hypothetical protein
VAHIGHETGLVLDGGGVGVVAVAVHVLGG